MAIPRYQQIAEDLLRKITSGTLPVGAVLPAELQLMQTYEASRNTVRSALQQLQNRGLISRRRNRGTMVEAPPQGSGTFTQSLSSLDSLITLASKAQRRIVGSEEVVLDIATGRELGCPPGSRWYRIRMVRSEGRKAKPLGWTDAYVDPRYADVRELAEKHPDKLLIDLLETSYGRRVETVKQTVSACAVTPDIAAYMGVTADTPALRVVRQYRDAVQALVVVTRSLYPENRYSLSTTLTRSRETVCG